MAACLSVLCLASLLPSHHVAHRVDILGAQRRTPRLILANEGRPEDERGPPAKGEDGKVPEPKGGLLAGLLGGLPWWFPLAIGWLIAPNFGLDGGAGGDGPVPTTVVPEDIFSPPTVRQERQILREERSVFQDREENIRLEQELYGR
jgi:hypothetical protein